MHYEAISIINQGIKKTKKVIITLGCSFVEGQGAVDQKIWDTYYKMGMSTDLWDWILPIEQQQEIISAYPDISLLEGQVDKLNFQVHESNNSFGSILCKKYFNDEYTCINLGRRGNGNKATIKDLYFYPDILWDKIQEIIVIFCPSGMERYDFMDDKFAHLNKHGRWITFWPASFETGFPRKMISEGIRDCIASPRATTLEQIANIQELLLWCKYKKAKLIIIPAFTRGYNRTVFLDSVSMEVTRELNRKVISEEKTKLNTTDIEKIVDMWPWENMFYPRGYPTLADLSMAQEKSLDWKNGPIFYNYMKIGTPDKWITPCAHPSVKAHDLFASILYEHLQEIL